MKTKSTIPIVILHRNDGPNLDIMINSIIKNTTHPYEIFIVDNNSNHGVSKNILDNIEINHKSIHIIRSAKNNWIFGFNLVFKHPNWKPDYKYYIFSDPDIEVPEKGTINECWLTYMVREMDENVCIGKLGISLSLDGIDRGDIYEKVVAQEKKYDTFPAIGSNRICPVDSTLAIYRTDFFVYNKFRFNIGHATLARPYYYTCRTSRVLEAKHLGWYNRGKTNNTDELLPDKIKCFARYAAYIEPAVIESSSLYIRLYYKVIHLLATIFWGTTVILNLLVYYLKNFPRNINKIQAFYK